MMPITMNFWGEQALDFLQNALNMWNDKYNSILDILTTSPSEFQGGGIWGTVSDIITVIEGTGITLLVIFFLYGLFKSFCCQLSLSWSFTDDFSKSSCYPRLRRSRWQGLPANKPKHLGRIL